MKTSSLTQMQQAKTGVITPQMKAVAQDEDVAPEYILQEVAKGRVVLNCSRRRKKAKLLGIGRGLRTKVNANIGTSQQLSDLPLELEKLRIATEAGADTVMDLSTGGDLPLIRREILQTSTIPVGTVPLYQAAAEEIARSGDLLNLSADHIFEVIEEQAEDGVDFITVHCGITLKTLERLQKQKRLIPMVSRGGAFLANWMLRNNQENPLYEQFPRLLKLAAKHDLILSLGDGLRPGAIADATDRPQLEELVTLGELTEEAWKADVAIIIEGPGHVPLEQVRANVLLAKRLTQGAPFYVLGPLVTDVAPGYDHLVGAIGGAQAGAAGADFLCYVTPGEHLRLPTLEDVEAGVAASKIAAHVADLSKGLSSAWQQDYNMSHARRELDWAKQIEYALTPRKVKDFCHHTERGTVCTMCGEFCALKWGKIDGESLK